MTDTRAIVTPSGQTAAPREADRTPTASGRKAVSGAIPTEDPEVGLSQKGSGEDAIIRRETEV